MEMLHICLDEYELLTTWITCQLMNTLEKNNQSNYIIINIILIIDRILVDNKENLLNWYLMDGSNLNLMILNHCRRKTILSEYANMRICGLS